MTTLTEGVSERALLEAKSQAEILSDSGELDAFTAALEPDDYGRLLFDFSFWGRPVQFMPVEIVGWFVWAIITGRGWGKTYTGANNIHEAMMRGGYRRAALVGRTAGDVRDTMVEGPSGILAVAHPSERPKYEPSKRRLTWPNGAVATTYTADKADQLRGPEHDIAWCDEVATWKQSNGKCAAWDNLLMGMRVGPKPRVIVTTTPRPTKFIRDLMALDTTFVQRGHSDENISNLHPDYYRTVLAPYKGTRLGRQEIGGEVLEDVEGALWSHDEIDTYRLSELPEGVGLVRVVIGVDPSGSTKTGNEIGIVGAGKGSDGHYYVLRDRSLLASPLRWGETVAVLYAEIQADRVVGEVNYGGAMVEATLRNATGGGTLSYAAVVASRGKQVRAEPIAALYERGLVHHIGMFPELEDQMTSWTQDSPDSPDRMDALVWTLTELTDTAGQGVW